MRSTRSLATSQIAWRSTLRAFWQDSKWANCAIGPQPSTPTFNRRSCFAIGTRVSDLFVHFLNKLVDTGFESRGRADDQPELHPKHQSAPGPDPAAPRG